MHSPSTPALLSVASTLLTTASASCLHATPLMPRQVTGNTVAVSKYGYTGLDGPLNWYGLEPSNWSTCATGSLQSPISINTSSNTSPTTSISINTTSTIQSVPSSAMPNITWPDVRSAVFENLGSTVEVLMNGTTVFGGKTYSLAQFHFHTPGEHRIDDEYSPVEMHLVHTAADNTTLVLAQLFELTSSLNTTTSLLQTLFSTSTLQTITTPGAITRSPPISLTQIQQNLLNGGLYTYNGSLTTPPCSEGVTWLVGKKKMGVDVDSFNALKKVVKFNARYTQDGLGERNLLLNEGVVLKDGGMEGGGR